MNAILPPLSDPRDPPAPVARAPFARWLWERQIGYREASERLGVSHTTVWQWCLPFSDLNHKTPDDEQAQRVRDYTRGEIGPDSFRRPVGGVSS